MTRILCVALAALTLLTPAPPAGAAGSNAAAQGRDRDRREAPRPQRAEPRRPPPRPAPPRPSRGTFVFIGGYFYDPFFGPYPWWHRGAYPPWYYPVYDNHAEVRVACTPEEAAVYVDGFYAGIVDDFNGTFQRLALPPGGHRLTLYLPGFLTHELSVYLRPAATFTLRHTMLRLPPGETSELPRVASPVPTPPEGTYVPPRTTPPTTGVAMPAELGDAGTLELHVQPVTAEVIVDGARWLSSEPGVFVLQLPAGPHRIEVSAAGYRTFTSEATVRAGEATPVNVSLVRITTR
jgi:hypothetical protein